jgi:hypothetical protein
LRKHLLAFVTAAFGGVLWSVAAEQPLLDDAKAQVIRDFDL